LPKLYRNRSVESDTARCSLAGLRNTGRVERSADSGSGSTPLIWAASMAIAASPRFWPSSFSAIMPPKEWPTRTGGCGRASMTAA
jgi:hypothetical protein